MIEVYYRTARGASMARCFYDVTSAHFFIASLRRAARIFAQCGSDRKQIGEVTKLDGRWHWYYDREAAEQSVQADTRHAPDGKVAPDEVIPF